MSIVKILIQAADETKQGLASAETNLRSLEKTAGEVGKSASKSFEDIAKKASEIGKPMRNAGLAITAGVTLPLGALITKSTMAAAKVDSLDLIVKQLGATAGYTEGEIMGYAEAVRKQGIEAASSREIIAKFITAQLDAADAAGLARIAQDQAVISGENSTATMERLTDALITGNSQMFRSMKMNVDLGASYEAMAESLGKNVDELTEVEMVQARVNAVTAYGATIQGTYEAAMGDSFKQMGSFKRYLDDIYVAMGQYFTPALSEGVEAVGGLLKAIPELISEGGALEPVLQSWGDAASDAAGNLADMTEKLKNMSPETAVFIGDMLAATAGMGGMLLVGGQAIIWLSKLAPLLGTSVGAMTGFGLAVYAATAGIVWFNSVSKTHAIQIDSLMRSMAGAGKSYDEFADSVDNATENTMNGIKVLAQNAGNYKQMEEALREAKDAGVITNGVFEQMYFDMKNGIVSIDDTRESLYNLLTSHIRLAEGMAASDEHMVRVAGNFGYIATGADDAATAIYEHERAMNRAAVRAIEYGGAADIARQALEDLGVEAEEQKRLLDDLADATSNKTAADLLLEDVNLRLTKLWADNAISAERYNDALELANQVANEYPEALSALMEMFGEWGSRVQNISDLLNGLPSEIKIDIIQTWYESQGGTWGGSGNVGAGQNNPDGGGPPGIANALGGFYQTNSPTLFRSSEYGQPETAVFVPQGKSIYDVASPAEISKIMPDGSGGGGGNTYNYYLTMPTTADPTDVVMAFELLEAYGGN